VVVCTCLTLSNPLDREDRSFISLDHGNRAEAIVEHVLCNFIRSSQHWFHPRKSSTTSGKGRKRHEETTNADFEAGWV